MNFFENKDYYRVLGVERTASFNNITKAKDRLKYGNPDDRVPFNMWGKIDEAYSVLSDPGLRKEYDNYLANKEVQVNPPEVTSEETPEVTSEETPEVTSEETPEVTSEETPEVISEETPEVISEETPEVIPFTPVAATEKKLSSLKMFGGILVGYAVAGPIGAGLVAAGIWLKRKKHKLSKDNSKKSIMYVTTEEMNLVKEYNSNLEKEIDKLLSEEHNNYKLKIYEAKYKNQIQLLEKILEIKINKKMKTFGNFKNNMEVMAIKFQIADARAKLREIEKSILEYEGTQRLTNLNLELIKANNKISMIEKEREISRKKGQVDPKSFELKNLKVYKNKLLNKRNRQATIVKAKVVRSGKIYEDISKISIKNWFKSLSYVFKTPDEMDKIVTEEPQITR